MPTSSSTGSSAQSAESHDRGLRPLVHGRNSLSAGAGWPQLLWGANQGGSSTTTRDHRDQFRRQHPLTQIGQYNWPRFGYEVTTAGSSRRPDVGQGPAHPEGRLRVPPPPVPARRMVVSTGGPFDFNRLDTGGYDTAGTISVRPGIRSRHSCWVRCSSRTRPSRCTRHSMSVHGRVVNDEFKVNDELDADPRPALRLPVRPHRE